MLDLIEKKYLTPPDNEAIPVLKCFFCEEDVYEGDEYYVLNGFYYGDNVLPSQQQKIDGTAGCFQSLFQDSLRARMCAKNSFADWMIYYYKNRKNKWTQFSGNRKFRR